MRRELGGFAFFLLLAIALTWPLALHLDTAVPDRGDPLLVAWILDWVDHALTHSPLQLFDAPIYHPGIYPLAYSENLVGVAVVVLPFHLAGLPALATYNIAVLLGFAFAAYGAWVLARLVTGSTAGALLAGIFYAFGSFKIAHVQHLQIIWSAWLPLLLAALLFYWRRGDTRSAVLLGAAFAMNGLSNIYWLVLGAFMLAVTVAFLAVADARRERTFWLRLLLSLAIACIVLAPFLWPYHVVAREYGAGRTTGEARPGSATVTSWLIPSSRNLLYGQVPDPALHLDERELFPGLLVLFLATYAFLRKRGAGGTPPPHLSLKPRLWLDILIVVSAIATYLTMVQDRITIGRFSFAGSDVPAMLTLGLVVARFWPRIREAIRTSRFTSEELVAALWIAIGFVGSLGWNAPLHPFLFRVLSPFRATRTPARWAVIAYIGLAVWAAIGMKGRRRMVSALLVVFAVVEVVPRIQWQSLDPHVAPVYRWLARAKPGVVLELPIIAEGVPFEYMLAQTEHRVPMINGASGWETPLHELLRKKEEKLEYDETFFAEAAKNDASVVIVHETRLTPEQRTALLPMTRSLRPVARFGSDAVYELRTRPGPAGSASAPPGSLPR